MLDDQAGDRIVALEERLELDRLAGEQSLEHRVVGHEHALVDVVAGVDRREGRGDRDPDAGPLLDLDGLLPRGAGALALAGHDDLESAVQKRTVGEEPLPRHDQTGVGVDARSSGR
jgi:hypothetical protein